MRAFIVVRTTANSAKIKMIHLLDSAGQVYSTRQIFASWYLSISVIRTGGVMRNSVIRKRLFWRAKIRDFFSLFIAE